MARYAQLHMRSLFYANIVKKCQEKFYMACKILILSQCNFIQMKKIFSMLVEYKYLKNHVIIWQNMNY